MNIEDKIFNWSNVDIEKLITIILKQQKEIEDLKNVNSNNK